MSEKKDKRSDVWEFFKEPIKKNDKLFTTCMLCNTEMAYHSGTSSMRNHRQRRHPSKSKSSGQVGALVGRQTTLTSSWIRKPMSSQVYEKHTKNLALMCAIDARPLSICQGVGFKRFVRDLNPDYQVPSRTTVTKYLHKLYHDAKIDVVQSLKDQSVSITSDIWTSVALDGYLSVTGHYIDNDWVLQNKNLSTKPMNERHSGVNIAAAIKSVATEFGIDSIPCLVTDNASNMSVASREAGVPHSGCFAHTLQLCVEDGLKLNPIHRALGAARRLVGHFNHSVVSTQAVLQKQQSNKPLKLVQDVSTRWNSSYLMIKRLLHLRVPVFAVLHDDKVTKTADRSQLDMTDANWKVLETIMPILEPFVQATEVLAREDTATASQVFVLLSSLFQTLDDNDQDNNTCRELKAKIKQGLMKRFHVDQSGTPTDEVVTSSPLALALALDPRYKSLKVLSVAQRNCKVKD